MKKLFSLLSLFLAGATALTLTAQDNPCGVDGVVVEASSFQYSPASLSRGRPNSGLGQHGRNARRERDNEQHWRNVEQPGKL